MSHVLESVSICVICMTIAVRKLYTPAYTIMPKVLHCSHMPLAKLLKSFQYRAGGGKAVSTFHQHCLVKSRLWY